MRIPEPFVHAMTLRIPEPDRQFLLVKEHIAKLRTNLYQTVSKIKIYVERNLGFEAEHHHRALHDIPGVEFYTVSLTSNGKVEPQGDHRREEGIRDAEAHVVARPVFQSVQPCEHLELIERQLGGTFRGGVARSLIVLKHGRLPVPLYTKSPAE